MKQFEGDASFKALFKPYIGREITLAEVYEMAALVTRFYRDAGYLLSYAYVPMQRIEDGQVTLTVVEGFIAEVEIEGDDPNSRISQAYIKRLSQQTPLQDKTLESVLLRLNDLPGRNYRAVLRKDPERPEAESVLTLVPQEKAARISLSADNFNSRYLGPHQLNASYADSFLPEQQTTLVGLTSLPLDRLNYGLLNHAWQFAPDWTLDGTAGITKSEPGFTLRRLGIDSLTTSLGLGVRGQLIRKRDENFMVRLGLDARDIDTDINQNTPLIRDRVRVIRTGFSYDNLDSLGGSNLINATFSLGVDGLGASAAGALNLSRAQAQPDFKKFDLTVSRAQRLSDQWTAQLQVAGQYASEALYASEEFGVGGQLLGRAYDNSEIVGDYGIAAGLELHYTGLRTMQPINIEPFIFIDGGVVRNHDVGQRARDSLTSAGLGTRFATESGYSGLIGAAFPLTREVGAPLYGQNDSGPRLLVQLTRQF